jgi:hypothetical protein
VYSPLSDICGYLSPPSSEIIIINNPINTLHVKTKTNIIKSTIIYNLFTYKICSYTHYNNRLKSFNQIPLNFHRISQISYPNSQVVYQYISPNNHL